jgi:hypothetical protein
MSVRRKKSVKVELPKELLSKRIEVEFELGKELTKAFAFVGLHPDDTSKPVEIFLKHPHVDEPTVIQFIDLSTRLISLCLRYSSCPHCGEESLPLARIIKQLDETDGQSLYSVPKIFVQTLANFLPEGTPVGKCKECGGDTTIVEKCKTCLSCGWSKCG